MAADAAEMARVRTALADRWWRLNNLYWITDKWGKKVRFKPNWVQAQLDDRLWFLNIVLKSRQHGVTTWACIRALDMILFRSNCKAGIVAHTAADAAKFFRQKVLYAYDNLPDWLKALRPAVRRDMRDGILELSNGSSIEVSVSHRGGTLQFLHISEYGPMCSLYPERAKEVAAGALNTVAAGNIVVIESTARGASGDFYERCQTAMSMDAAVRAGTASLSELDYRFHFFGWYHDQANAIDPGNVPIPEESAKYFELLEGELGIALSAGQRAWYVKKAADQREHMTSEHPSTPAEAFRSSVDGAYYGMEMAKAEAEGRICDLPFNPAQPVYTFWDIGHSDASAIWFMQENGPWFDFIGYYEASGEQAAHYAKQLQIYTAERDWLYSKAYLPHDIEVTEWVGTGDNKTRRELLEDMGVKPIEVVPRISNVLEGIDMVRRVLPRCRFDRTRCGPPKAGDRSRRGGIEALRNYRKEYNEKLETFRDTPLHDWCSHGADAFRQFAQGFQPARVVTRRRDAFAGGGGQSWKATT